MNFRLKTAYYGIVIIAASTVATIYTKTIDCTDYSYDQLCRKYVATQAFGMEAHIDITGCNIELIRTATTIQEYVTKLCQLLNMRLFEQPSIAHFSDSKKMTGYAFVVQTAQGTLWGRFTNHNNSAFITIFSAAPYNPYTIADYTKKQFDAAHYTLSIGLRA